MKTAFITGVAGQDGSYLAELLLSKGYEVYGLMRSSGRDAEENIAHILDSNFKRVYGDILQRETLQRIAQMGCDEVYHLAAQSHVGQSFKNPLLAFESTALATIRLLEYIRECAPRTKVYIASTSEMLIPEVVGAKGNEDSKLNAHSPYGVGKVAAHLMAKVYREAFGLFIVSGIAYNHESRRRGPNFVTKKIANGIANWILTGKPVQLGRMDVYRDWHHAKDTVMGMYLAMQHKVADDYIFASGKARTVNEFASTACRIMGLTPCTDIIVSNPDKYEVRPWDVDYLCGDPSKAEEVLDWQRTYTFKEMVSDVCMRWPE